MSGLVSSSERRYTPIMQQTSGQHQTIRVEGAKVSAEVFHERLNLCLFFLNTVVQRCLNFMFPISLKT